MTYADWLRAVAEEAAKIAMERDPDVVVGEQGVRSLVYVAREFDAIAEAMLRIPKPQAKPATE